MDGFDWSVLLADLIPQAWLATRGQQVKIALIDTGVDLNVHSLGHLERPGHNFFVGKPGFTVFDHGGRDNVTDGFVPSGHGTRLAGIIAGRSDADKQDALDGIANQADVYVIKARHNFSDNSGDFTNPRSVLDGIRLATSLGIEVAVVASSLPLTELTIPASEVREAINEAEAKGMIIINAVENRAPGENWTGLTSNYFPSSEASLIKVAVAPTDIAATRAQISGEKIHFLLGGFQGKVYGKGNRLISPRTTNSAATAIMGSIVAICVSFLKSQGKTATKAEVLAALSQLSKPLSAADGVYAQPVIYKNF